jgi:uncharacterized protein YjiS (DUF1127 family)
MAYLDFDIIRKVKRMVSDFSAHRREVRTERYLNSLPEHMLKDIGWPDAYAERLAHRAVGVEKEANDNVVGLVRTPRKADWPKQYETLRSRKYNALEQLHC